MAVRAFTNEPEALMSAIKRSMANGRIKSWKIDQDGDLTLADESFANKAWMRPKVLSDRLLFNIVGRRGDVISKRDYAVYHARLVQLLLANFDTKLKTVTATALPTSGDQLED